MVEYYLLKFQSKFLHFVNHTGTTSCSRFPKLLKEVTILANIKSAAKRAQIAKVRTLRNKSAMSKVKTTIKGVEAAVAANDAEAAKAALAVAIKTIDKAASNGLLHKNNAANKKSRLTKMVNAM